MAAYSYLMFPFCTLSRWQGRLSRTKYIWYNSYDSTTSRVFLAADAQLLGTSLAGARMPLSICLENHYLNRIYVAQLHLAQHCANSLYWLQRPRLIN